MKRSRSKRVSSGVRKARAIREGANVRTRKQPIVNPAHMSFLRAQDRDRWPTKDTCDRYAKLNREKPVGRNPASRSKPATFSFTFLEIALGTSLVNLKKLLVAASLKVKVVKRHPGYVLQRTYNHGNRTIEII